MIAAERGGLKKLLLRFAVKIETTFQDSAPP